MTGHRERSRDPRRLPGVVRGLLGVALGGSLACGCLLANPPDLEDPVGSGPVIVRVTPSEAFVTVDLDAENLAQVLGSFGAVVREEDVEQDLFYRWFVDYDPEAPIGNCNLVDRQTLRPTGGPERDVPPPILRPALLDAAKCYRLTLVVTDGGWDGCATVVEGAHRTSHDWWLLVHDGGTSPREVPATQCQSKTRPLSS